LGLAPFNFQTFSTVADRYAYLSMFGVAIGIATVIGNLKTKTAASVLLSAVIAAFAILSVRQMSHWQNGWTLFTLVLVPFGGSLMLMAFLVTFALLVGYVVLLMRTQKLAAERRAKVHYLPQPATSQSSALVLRRTASS